MSSFRLLKTVKIILIYFLQKKKIVFKSFALFISIPSPTHSHRFHGLTYPTAPWWRRATWSYPARWWRKPSSPPVADSTDRASSHQSCPSFVLPPPPRPTSSSARSLSSSATATSRSPPTSAHPRPAPLPLSSTGRNCRSSTPSRTRSTRSRSKPPWFLSGALSHRKLSLWSRSLEIKVVGRGSDSPLFRLRTRMRRAGWCPANFEDVWIDEIVPL